VLGKGQAATGLYRFLAKHGGYVWMQTSAALSGDENSERREKCVICVNYVIRSALNSDLNLGWVIGQIGSGMTGHHAGRRL